MSTAPAGEGWVPEDSFALRLAMTRFRLGVSQEEAAKRTGLKASTWATWETGARPRGMDLVVQKISDGLGVDRGWLMFGGPLHDWRPDPGTPGEQVDRPSPWMAEVVELRAA